MRGKLEKRGDFRPDSKKFWAENEGWDWKYEGKSKSDGENMEDVSSFGSWREGF
jgi:hypothetical protein